MMTVSRTHPTGYIFIVSDRETLEAAMENIVRTPHAIAPNDDHFLVVVDGTDVLHAGVSGGFGDFDAEV